VSERQKIKPRRLLRRAGGLAGRRTTGARLQAHARSQAALHGPITCQRRLVARKSKAAASQSMAKQRLWRLYVDNALPPINAPQAQGTRAASRQNMVI